MILKKRFLVPALLLLAMVVYFSGRATSADVIAPTVENGQLVFHPESNLFKKLEVASVKSGNGTEKYFKIIGQIVALANSSTLPTEQKIDWVELDPRFTKKMGLDLDRLKDAKIGDAFGVGQVAGAYGRKIKEGDRILIQRYGLLDTSLRATEGKIVKVIPEPEDMVPVIFKIENGSNWLPGTNCEVAFPLLPNQDVKIPTVALLHEGIYEYVLKETGPGRFVPEIVTIGEGTPDEVDVVEGLRPGERIVVRGAILLKPLLHELIKKEDL